MQYPPGLPAALSVVWAFGGGPGAVVWWARAADVVLVGFTAGVIWHIATRRIGLRPLLAALFAGGPLFLDSALQYFGLALAEPWFMALWAASLMVSYRAGEREGSAAAAGVLVGFAALFRTQALAFIPALAVGTWIRTRQAREGGRVLAGSVAPLLVLGAVRVAVLRSPGAAGEQQSYLTDLVSRAGGSVSGLGSNVWFNLKGYTLLFSLYTSFWPLLGVLIVAGFTALAAAGALRLWRLHPELVLTVAANAAVILLWPYNIDRFVVSALPFVGVLAAGGAQALVEGKGARVRMGAFVVLAALAVQVAARQVDLRVSGERQAQSGERPEFWSPSWEVPYFDRFIRKTDAWIEAEAPADARILTPWPVAIWLHTGRPTFDSEGPEDLGPSAETPAAAIAKLSVRDTIDVVVVGHPDQRVFTGVAGLLDRCPEAVSRAGATPPYGLPAFYRVDSAAGCISGVAAGAVEPPAPGTR